MQADQADLRAFEAAAASARSRGLFFQTLYQPESEEQQQDADTVSSSSRAQQTSDPSAARKIAAAVASSAEEEVGSPFRMYLFGAMTAVLLLVVLQGERQHLQNCCKHTTTMQPLSTTAAQTRSVDTAAVDKVDTQIIKAVAVF